MPIKSGKGNHELIQFEQPYENLNIDDINYF